jgi:hypothetical protein
MIKEIDASISLKINDIEINIDINKVHDLLNISIYENKTHMQLNDYYFGYEQRQMLKESGFTDEEIEKMYLLNKIQSVDINDVRIRQNKIAVTKLYNKIQKYVTGKEPLTEREMQALSYINKESISFEKYKQLPEIIKDQYCLTFNQNNFEGKYKSCTEAYTENIKFLILLILKFKNYISYMIFNSKLTAVRTSGNDILKVKISTDNINHILVTIKENITDDAGYGDINYNIIPIKELHREFAEMFKDFDTSKLTKVQIPKDEALKTVKNNYIKTKYYYQLKPEIVKQKEELVKNIAIALCEKKNKNSVANLIDEAEEIINMPYYPETENPDPKFYECYDTYRYIDKHVHDYTMQNEPYNLTISDAIRLMEIILTK